MIREVLQLILNESIASTSEIAERIGIQEETLTDIIRLLVSRGYLRLGDCGEPQSTSCSHCPIPCGSSSTTHTGHAFIVTERGKRFAQPLRKGD